MCASSKTMATLCASKHHLGTEEKSTHALTLKFYFVTFMCLLPVCCVGDAVF